MTNEELQADLKAEWANLDAIMQILRNLVFALDHSGLEWDASGNRAWARLDDALIAAYGVLPGSARAKESQP